MCGPVALLPFPFKANRSTAGTDVKRIERLRFGPGRVQEVTPRVTGTSGERMEFFRIAGEQFGIVGPVVPRPQIEAVFPESFPGRDSLIEFYSNFNGGSRSAHGCVVFCSNPAHRVRRDALEQLCVEGFRSIPRSPEDRMLPLANLLRHQATMRNIYSSVPEMAKFLETHLAIAFDHTGNDLCINRHDGRMYFIDWRAYSEGPVEVASSFPEFVLRFWNAGNSLAD